VRYRERDEAERERFVKALEVLSARSTPVYFLDESGVDHRLFRPWARAPRGQKVYADIPGARRGRTSVISASRYGRLVQPMVFEGHCDRTVVEAYFSKVLLPAIAKGSVIVLDNASFHRCPSLRVLVEAAGCSLLFLPAYSPDLNPIEHLWAVFKRAVQAGLLKAKNKFIFISKICQCYC